MATVIRLTRKGRKNAPFYRIVACDKKYARDGRFIDVLGHYNPLTKQVKIDKAKVEKFTTNGARISRVVTRLLKKIDKADQNSQDD